MVFFLKSNLNIAKDTTDPRVEDSCKSIYLNYIQTSCKNRWTRLSMRSRFQVVRVARVIRVVYVVQVVQVVNVVQVVRVARVVRVVRWSGDSRWSQWSKLSMRSRW